jgi:hypothetical protein
MDEDGEITKIVDTTEREKGGHKIDDITATPARAEVTPNGKLCRECKQEAPKKIRGIIKKGLKDYFGEGNRTPAPSMEADPVSTVVHRRDSRGTKSPRAERASNSEGQNKKPRSDNEDLEEEENTKGKEGSWGMEEQGGFIVDLESMSAMLKKKSTKVKVNKKRRQKIKRRNRRRRRHSSLTSYKKQAGRRTRKR